MSLIDAIIEFDIENIFEGNGTINVLIPSEFDLEIISNDVRIPYDYAQIEGERFYIDQTILSKIRHSYLHLENVIIGSPRLLNLIVNLFKVNLNGGTQKQFESSKIYLGAEVEKMSKSKFNVVNPDDIIEKNGADALQNHGILTD